MKRYQQFYNNISSDRYKAREEYANIQFTSPDITKFNTFKRIKKDIWYFYLVAIVVICVILLIYCTKHNEEFVKVWLIFASILALNTIMMLISMGIITQIKENKAIKARSEEEKIMNKAKIANDELAKASICMISIARHNYFLNYCAKYGTLEEEQASLIAKYIKIVNEINNNLATSDDFISTYQEIIAKEEIKDAKNG